MDADQAPPSRPHRIVVNVDTETLRLLDAMATVSRESRSAVAAGVLSTFSEVFRPVAVALGRVKTEPAVAMKALASMAETLQSITAGIVEEARMARPPAAGEAGRPQTRASGSRPAGSAAPDDPPSSNTGG